MAAKRWIVSEFGYPENGTPAFETKSEARAFIVDLFKLWGAGSRKAVIVDARTVEPGWSGTVVEAWAMPPGTRKPIRIEL